MNFETIKTDFKTRKKHRSGVFQNREHVSVYLYGFNGMERDDEARGKGNQYQFGDYSYDPRLARRFNDDPLSYAWQSTYAAFNNNPIYFSDPTGLQGDPPNGGKEIDTGKKAESDEYTTSEGGNRIDTELDEFTITPDGPKEPSQSGGKTKSRNRRSETPISIPDESVRAEYGNGWNSSFKGTLPEWQALYGGQGLDHNQTLDFYQSKYIDEPRKEEFLNNMAHMRAEVVDHPLYQLGLFALTSVAPMSTISITLRNSAIPVTRVFWSGSSSAMRESAKFASSKGLQTLEMTIQGRILTNVSPYLPKYLSSPLWRSASRGFARGTTGEAHFFPMSPRAGSIWNTIEKPILQQNRINIITH